jgi:eukaryotic-like serine/threonine-protein kinase
VGNGTPDMNTLGRYQLVEKLGQGGMGVVYRAFDTLLQRVVAVKIISGTIESGSEQRERFFREARAAGQLSHRNIITIHDLGEHEGQPYLAMEYLEGQDLQHRLARPERMSLARKVELAIEICEGLEFAHARGVVHRDIKPANIFITDNGTAKILDFGLARLMTSELTNSKVMMGTINYMAPEQVRGERADQRSDIFALGVVLYELLGGRKAFEGESVAATLYKIVQEDPQPLLTIDPSLPPDLVAIVDRALAKPRDERYQQISEMLRDLVVYRQQMAAMDSPGFGRPGSGGYARPSMASRPASQPGDQLPGAPTERVPTPPSGNRSEWVEPTRPSGPIEAPAGPPSRAGHVPARRGVWLLAAAVLVTIAAAGLWLGGSRETPPEGAAPHDTGLTAALQQARDALDQGRALEAQRHAETALAQAPDDAEARRLRDRAVAAQDDIRRGLEEARGHFEAGRFQEASRAAGTVLGLSPGHPEARQLMDDAVAGLRGSGADDARNRMEQAKAGARAAAAASLAPAAYNAALGAERTAQRAHDAGDLDEAAARFYEASGLFRSAEVSAQSEAAARADRAAAARRESERLERERLDKEKADKERADKERADNEERAAKERAEKERAARLAPPPVTEPPPAAPVKPATPAPPRPTAPEPSAESLITELLKQYEAALEARSLNALKRLWPALAGAQEAAIRNEFEHAASIEVGIVSPRIDVAGGTATATFTRQYNLVTTDGQRLASRSLTTMSCRRTAEGWVIEQVLYEPIR